MLKEEVNVEGFYRGKLWNLLEGGNHFSVKGTYRFLVGNGVKALMAEISASNSPRVDCREILLTWERINS